MPLAFDIETLPLERTAAGVTDRELSEEEIKRASLTPRDGRVAAIGYANDDKEWATIAQTEEVERPLLDHFQNTVLSALYDRDLIVTWNGIAFDLPFITRRMMIHGIRPDPEFRRFLVAARRRYAFTPHFDVKMALTDWRPGKDDGLDNWLRSFGLAGKVNHGSHVYAMARRGEWQEIATYAQDDARKTMELYDRIQTFY